MLTKLHLSFTHYIILNPGAINIYYDPIIFYFFFLNPEQVILAERGSCKTVTRFGVLKNLSNP